MPAKAVQSSDTLRVNSAADSLQTAGKKKGNIQTKIYYDAEDSITMDLASNKLFFFKNSKVKYGNSKLEAEYIKMNYKTHFMEASGKTDSAGVEVGKPVFTEGQMAYETDSIRYNFRSRRALISGVVTKQGEGYLHGNRIKKAANDEVFVDHAKYTTCNLPNPHFHVEANKIKMIPDNKLVSGPFHLEFADIALPIYFPFGIFPMPDKRASGLIVPSFGDELRRGFFLKNGGYYFHFNDYIDLNLTGDIYTKGSWAIRANSNYKVRYKYNGGFSIDYSNNTGVSEVDRSESTSFWVRWNHSPISRPKQGRFSASLNFGSNSYNQENFNVSNFNNSLSQNFSSSVSYSKQMGRLFNLTATGNLTQNIQSKEVDLRMPSVNLSMNRINPFLKRGKTPKNLLDKLTISYSLQGALNLTNRNPSVPSGLGIASEPEDSKLAFSFNNASEILKRSRYGLKHNIPVATSMKLFKHFTLSPSFNWNEITYFNKLNYEWDGNKKAVKIDTAYGVNRVYTYSTSASLNTNIYGFFSFASAKNPEPKISKIRHVMRPSVSFSYSPDFGSDHYGYYQDVQINEHGDMRRLSHYNGFLYGTPGSGRNASMSFNLTNNLEMKVRNDKKKGGKSKKGNKKEEDKYKVVPILESFNFGASYNFAADSFNLSNISWSARTRIFNNKLNISLSGTLDPYVYVLEPGGTLENPRQRRINRFSWQEGQGIGQLSSMSLALSTSLNQDVTKSRLEEQVENDPTLTEADRADLQNIIMHSANYVDWEVPWDVRINYNLSYRKVGFAESVLSQSMRFSGNLNLTEKWKVTFNSGYNFDEKKFTQTSLGISRDLHCWQASVSWVPFGTYTSYNFTIRAKSSLLQDLKLEKTNSWRDQL